MLLLQDEVGYLYIYTHRVCYLLIYIWGLLEISEQNVRLPVMHCCVWWGSWLGCAVKRGSQDR